MEQEFLDWLNQRKEELSGRAGYVDDRIRIGIGDDAAVIEPSRRPWVVACDSIADGTHFETGKHSLTDIGRKAMAVNLSDMAAMAATPRWATLMFHVPSGFELDQLKRLFQGAESLAADFNVQIIGGDTNSWDGKLVVGATLIGEAENSVWTMDGGNAGDQVLVTGSFGGSILGRHLSFTPQCELAIRIAENYEVHAATDVSDSLALDLAQLSRASGFGAEIEFNQIPVSRDAHVLSEQSDDAMTPLDHALYDGEDFQLILVMSPNESNRLLNDELVGNELTRIGKLVPEPGLMVVHSDSKKEPLNIQGYRH